MIGLDTSLVIAFSGIINRPGAEGILADMQVVAGFPGGSPDNPSSWDRREKYTKELQDQGVEIYATIEELLANVDVVLLEEVDGRPHLEWARPVIEAGKPLFIDKRFLLANMLELINLRTPKDL